MRRPSRDSSALGSADFRENINIQRGEHGGGLILERTWEWRRFDESKGVCQVRGWGRGRLEAEARFTKFDDEDLEMR